jgi:hypothetical protein
MTKQRWMLLVGGVILLSGLTGCATPPEVKETGDLVVRYSQRLNEELQAFEKSLETRRASRNQRIADRTQKTKANEAYVNTLQRLWTVSQDKTAEHLFESVRSSRPKPLELSLTLPATTMVVNKKKKEKLYDPQIIETTILHIRKLTAGESPREQIDFFFEFAKEVWSQVSENQKQAESQAVAGESEAASTAAKTDQKMTSSIQ